PRRYVRALRAGIYSSWSAPWDIEQLGRIAERPSIMVERLRHGQLGDGRQWLLDFDALPKAKRRDAALLDLALQNAVMMEHPRADIVARAQALLDVDPWHVPARLVVAIDREIRAKRMREDRWLWSDLAGGRAVAQTSVVARMQRRLAA